MDLSNIQPPCEHVPHELVKKSGRNAEYISAYELNNKNLAFHYKQLADKTSLEWLSNKELRTKYKLWNCKRKYRPSLYEKELERQLNSPTSQISLETKRATDILNQNKGVIEQALREFENSDVQRALREFPSYVEVTRTALSAFSSDLNHRDILSRIREYTSVTDQILNSNISAEATFNMLSPHRALLEKYREWEPPKKPKKTKKQLEKELKQKDELLDEKDKQIEALLEKQDRKLEKRSREYQNHALIWRIDQALTKNLNGGKPTAIAVWNELENNYSEYDGEDGEDPIIQGIKNGVVEWRSKYGNSGKFVFTAFSKILSVVRKKYSNNSN